MPVLSKGWKSVDFLPETLNQCACVFVCVCLRVHTRACACVRVSRPLPPADSQGLGLVLEADAGEEGDPPAHLQGARLQVGAARDATPLQPRGLTRALLNPEEYTSTGGTSFYL